MIINMDPIKNENVQPTVNNHPLLKRLMDEGFLASSGVKPSDVKEKMLWHNGVKTNKPKWATCVPCVVGEGEGPHTCERPSEHKM